jgi:hypothetical protein
MTLLIWGVNHRMAWMIGDNRYYNAKNKFDNAKKVFEIQATNGHGLIGYSGAGAKVLPNGALFEISNWLENLFDGQNFTLEEALGKIREAAIKRRFGPMSRSVHQFAFAGYHDGKPLSLLMTSRPQKGKAAVTRFSARTRKLQLHMVEEEYDPVLSSPTLGHTSSGRLGSGARYVSDRDVLFAARVVKGRRDDWEAARRLNAYLARIVSDVSEQEGNREVGPESLFAVRWASGGGYHSWTPRSSPRADGLILPGIMSGWKHSVFFGLMSETLAQQIRSRKPVNIEAVSKAVEAAAVEFTDQINKVTRKPSDSF